MQNRFVVAGAGPTPGGATRQIIVNVDQALYLHRHANDAAWTVATGVTMPHAKITVDGENGALAQALKDSGWIAFEEAQTHYLLNPARLGHWEELLSVSSPPRMTEYHIEKREVKTRVPGKANTVTVQVPVVLPPVHKEHIVTSFHEPGAKLPFLQVKVRVAVP